MALRILEIVVPTTCAEEVHSQLAQEKLPPIIDSWIQELSADRSCVRVLVDAEDTETLTDAIAQICSQREGFRITSLPVEATLPMPTEETLAKEDGDAAQKSGRISREELFADVSDSSRLTRTFVIMTVLSALVAVIGLTRDNVVIIIGAMVLAPLLGPNVALALATALADAKLAWKSSRSLLAGLSIAFLIAVVAGAVLHPSAGIPQITARTSAGWGDLILAIASGIAGGLSYTTSIPSALVGVMVAVALLPPWVVFGMMLGSSQWGAAVGALLLTLLNLICLNLTGVLTFVLQGVSPGRWWEAKKARRMSVIAVCAWSVLLGVLIVLLFLADLR